MSAAQHSFHIVFIFLLHNIEFLLFCQLFFNHINSNMILLVTRPYMCRDIDVLKLAFHRSSTLFCICVWTEGFGQQSSRRTLL